MTVAQFLIAMFALLIAGLMLPLPYGARMALFLALTTLAVLTFIGAGMHLLIGSFR
jgi:hypothetical protein